MGLGGIGIGPLIVILLLVVLLFGTKKLKGLGGDLGGAIKGFKKAMGDEEAKKDEDVKKVNADEAEALAKDTAKNSEKVK